MATMRAVQVSSPGKPFEMVEHDVPQPERGEALVRVHACGVCHSDAFAKEGGYPGSSHPLVPGHEIAGVIEGLGDGVEGWETGQRVGIGWFGGHCGYCRPCRKGDFINCIRMPITGVTRDGGYADYIAIDASALALIPDEIDAVDAGPLMCAGVTTFNALRHSGADPGDLVAILGIGGLGHLGVQYSVKAGYRTVAIARGTDKADLAAELGADHYIDSTAQDPAEELARLGGAAVVLATVTNPQAMSAVVGGLAPRGRVVVVGASMDPIQVPPAALIGRSASIVGHASGTSQDSEETLAFSALSGVRPMTETRTLDEAADAYDTMIRGDARFRMVLTMTS
ncbi:MAG: alcohol dehydrogenase [Acidimicrobiales bacterium]